LQDIKNLFDFIVTEEQIRFAEVKKAKTPSAYTPFTKELSEEPEPEPKEEPEAVSIAAAPSEEPEAIPPAKADKKQ
jgi:hypothetical protein